MGGSVDNVAAILLRADRSLLAASGCGASVEHCRGGHDQHPAVRSRSRSRLRDLRRSGGNRHGVRAVAPVSSPTVAVSDHRGSPDVVDALAGLALCVLAAKLLEIFEFEAKHQLDALNARDVAEERARFGRDLHDGTIQSIYAAALRLEAHRAA